MKKRGLSGVVTTIIIIAVSLVLIAGVGFLVNNFLNKGAGQISISKLTVDTKIKSAAINYTTDIASVRVKREVGPGDLVGIKFVFSDNKNSDVIERRLTGFNELAERTFDINLSFETPNLIVRNVNTVSIAPIIKLESGQEVIGKVSDIYEGLMENFTSRSKEDSPMCVENADCGIDYFLEGTRYCGPGSNVYQYKKVYMCIQGFCHNNIEGVMTEHCPTVCFNGFCQEQNISCTNQTVAIDCGVDGPFGPLSCSADLKSVVQSYKIFSCIDLHCFMTIISQTIKICNETQICFNGECFTPVECTSNYDCDPGKVCENGHCVAESPKNTGSVYSIWPFGIGEYFDSSNLPDPSNVSYVDKFISFTTGAEMRCFKVKEHKKPNVQGSYAYIRLNETVTNVTAGNFYMIWETDYFCGRS